MHERDDWDADNWEAAYSGSEPAETVEDADDLDIPEDQYIPRPESLRPHSTNPSSVLQYVPAPERRPGEPPAKPRRRPNVLFRPASPLAWLITVSALLLFPLLVIPSFWLAETLRLSFGLALLAAYAALAAVPLARTSHQR